MHRKAFVYALILLTVSPIYFTPAKADEWELAYDDGEYEYFWAWGLLPERMSNWENFTLAVKFTPPDKPVKLLWASFYITEEGGILYPFTVKLYDSNKNLLPWAVVVRPSTAGVVRVDLSRFDIVFEGDFYVGLAPHGLTQTPPLGLDVSNPDDRSFWVDPRLGFIPTSEMARIRSAPHAYGDFGIRVGVASLFETIVINSEPKIGTIIVDGTAYDSSRLPLTFRWARNSTHTIQVPARIVQVSDDTRYVFSGWNDGSSENTITIRATKKMNLTALWKKQYLLSVNSQYGSPTGAGWYDEGSRATATVPTLVELSAGTRVQFDGWSGDLSSRSSSVEVVMDRPRRLQASWRVQHLLTVDSVGPVVGGGWYDAGTIARIQAQTPQPVQEGVSRRVFTGWSGDATSSSPTLEILIDRPKSVAASWKTQYRVILDTDPTRQGPEITDWVDEGSAFKVDAQREITLAGGKSRYLFNRWSDGDSALSRQIIVNKAFQLTAEYELQHRLEIESTYGAVSGAGWYRSGETATFSVQQTSVPAGFLTTAIFEGWSGDYSGNSPTATVLMNGPKTVKAVWRTDSSQLFILGASVPIVAAVSYVIVRKRAKAGSSGSKSG